MSFKIFKNCIKLTCLISALAAGPAALAQNAPEFPAVFPDAQTAFVQTYGQAVVVQFAKVLKSSADSQCAASRNIGDEVLNRQARETLIFYGAKLNARYEKIPSKLQITARLMHQAGDTKSLEILRQTMDHPAMRALHAHSPVTTNAQSADDLANAFNAYVRNGKLPVKGQLGWADDGNSEMTILWENETEAPASLQEAAREPLDVLVKLFEPYTERTEAALKAAMADMEPDSTVFAGIEERLRALCIGAVG